MDNLEIKCFLTIADEKKTKKEHKARNYFTSTERKLVFRCMRRYLQVVSREFLHLRWTLNLSIKICHDLLKVSCFSNLTRRYLPIKDH